MNTKKTLYTKTQTKSQTTKDWKHTKNAKNGMHKTNTKKQLLCCLNRQKNT